MGKTSRFLIEQEKKKKEMEKISVVAKKALADIEAMKILQEAEGIALAKVSLENWLSSLTLQELRGLYKMSQAGAIKEYIAIAGKDKANAIKTNANTL